MIDQALDSLALTNQTEAELAIKRVTAIIVQELSAGNLNQSQDRDVLDSMRQIH
jgi:hypothetical protein